MDNFVPPQDVKDGFKAVDVIRFNSFDTLSQPWKQTTL